MRRKLFKLTMASGLVLLVVSFGWIGTADWVDAAYAQQNQNRGDGEIHVLPVQGNIYMLIGGGSNITMSVGVDGTLLVDAGTAGVEGLERGHRTDQRPVVGGVGPGTATE